MLLIYLFTVSVISMALLVMYKNDRHALKKMMARGRCGLPGYPNPGFMTDVADPASAFNKGDGKEKDKCPDPFDSQLETLSKIIIEKRKQIVDSKGRVDIAETTVKNLHLSSIQLRRRYQSIMEELRLEMESAEDECKDLNTFIAKANNLKQKFFQPDENECNEDSANAYSDNKASKESWGELPMCCNQKPKPKPEKKHDCHPPVPELCNRKFPSSCACPEKSLNPLATCRPPPPNCGKKCENADSNKYSENCDPCSKPKKNCSQTSGISSGRCSTQSMVKRTNPSVGSCCSPPQPPSNPRSQPCPAPLPSLLPRRLSSNNQSLPGSRKSSVSMPASRKSSGSSELTRNSSATSQRTSVSFQGQNSCPESNPCCCPCGKPPTSTYVKKPPYSSFLGERMQAAPIQRRIKQTVFTECEYEGGDDDETGSTIVTVQSSSITFPPSCCTSAYEEFLSAALKANKPPPIKLPTIVDECDPCAEIPREISEWEDTENVTHTCGTQTTSEEERRRRQEDVMNMYYENENRNRNSCS